MGLREKSRSGRCDCKPRAKSDIYDCLNDNNDDNDDANVQFLSNLHDTARQTRSPKLYVACACRVVWTDCRPRHAVLFDIISPDSDARCHSVSRSLHAVGRRLKGRGRQVAWNPSAN